MSEEEQKHLMQSYYDLHEKYYKLQQENKQLKVKSEVLEENNKLLIQQKAQMYNDLDIAYDKIDKAIEYIKEDIKSNYFKRYDDEVYKMCDDLLKILEGDKENNTITLNTKDMNITGSKINNR